MEYVQTVLVQIAADKAAEASRPEGLLADLDDHRDYLRQQPGFQDMRVTRSINPEGNVLLVVETRWQDGDSLVSYETREPTVMSIVNGYQDLIVPNTLQVLDMEALRSETTSGPAAMAAEARERLALPLLVPAGILAFMLLVIYGLSRIYLEVSNDVATPLAAGIAAGILVVAWFLTTNRNVQPWHVGSIVVAAAALLAGGTLYAAINEDDAEAGPEPGGATPTTVASPTPGGTPGGGGTIVEVKMIPTLKFDVTEMTLPANTDVTVRADNQDGGVLHNWAAYTDDSAAQEIAITEICSAPCVKEVTFTTPGPGDYFFRCDLHPQQMIGTLKVQ